MKKGKLFLLVLILLVACVPAKPVPFQNVTVVDKIKGVGKYPCDNGCFAIVFESPSRGTESLSACVDAYYDIEIGDVLQGRWSSFSGWNFSGYIANRFCYDVKTE